MLTPDPERYIANLIADALAGKLRLTLAEAARIAAAARVAEPERIAPLALAAWVERDPEARAILCAVLGHTGQRSTSPWRDR